MAFGKRVASPQASVHHASAAQPPQENEALIDELRAMARASGAKQEKFHGTVSGRLVKDQGEDADPVLVKREGVAEGGEVRRADYYASSALGNLSAIIGMVGGVALGFSPQGALGFTFVIWGLTAVATGRMMQGKAFRERIYMGRAARLAGLGVVATGAWFIYQGWSEPSLLGYFIPDYKSSVHGVFGPR